MQLDDALKGVASFIKALKFSDEYTALSSGFMHFNQDQIGGITLTGNERNEYIKCLNNLVQTFEKDNLFSRVGLDRLLQQTLLKACNGEDGLEQIPEERIKPSVNWLRQALKAPPKSYRHPRRTVSGYD